jgi:methylated-DNA-[protein]-cysteine S-methyltransferase
MQAPHAYDAILPAPFGALGVRLDGDKLVELVFLPSTRERGEFVHSEALARIQAELTAYFANPGHRFDLPMQARGTPFRQRVWQVLRDIPAGHTVSYGELARRIGSSPRAVGQAVGDNPIPIVIPCHRVVAADGGLGGFMHSRTGFSQDIKRWLLRHEHAR